MGSTEESWFSIFGDLVSNLLDDSDTQRPPWLSCTILVVWIALIALAVAWFFWNRG